MFAHGVSCLCGEEFIGSIENASLVFNSLLVVICSQLQFNIHCNNLS